MSKPRQSWRAKIQAYIVERRDEANREFDEFCQRWRIRPPRRVQEQQRRTTRGRIKVDGGLAGTDAEIRTIEDFVERYSQPADYNNKGSQASAGSKQHSQYRDRQRDGLSQPDEIDMFFSDTQSNENMTQSSMFYNSPLMKNSQTATKRVSFYKNKIEGRRRSAIPKQTPSPIRKQNMSPVFIKTNSTKTQTPSNLSVQSMHHTDAYDLDRRLAKLEEEVPIVQNRVYQLLNGHMIEYTVAGSPSPMTHRKPSIVASCSSDSNSPPRTPSHHTIHNDMMTPGHYYFTPKSPGSIMNSGYTTTHSVYQNTPTTSYQHTASPSSTNHDISSLKKLLKPTKQHKLHMKKIMYQMSFNKGLRKTDMIRNVYGELVPNPHWEEIYGEKYHRIY